MFDEQPDGDPHGECAAAIHKLQADLTAMEARKDAAYLERNQVVAALAKCFPSGIARTAIEGWSEDWHGCVYIDLPTGQASWHFHDSHAYLFEGLPAYTKPWDEHDTPEKYRRLAALSSAADPLAIALNTMHRDCHKAADAFWKYWEENGETHKRGYYESTWGAINRALRTVGVVPWKPQPERQFPSFVREPLPANCAEGDRCVCGGDTPAVRRGCGNWREPKP